MCQDRSTKISVRLFCVPFSLFDLSPFCVVIELCAQAGVYLKKSLLKAVAHKNSSGAERRASIQALYFTVRSFEMAKLLSGGPSLVRYRYALLMAREVECRYIVSY